MTFSQAVKEGTVLLEKAGIEGAGQESAALLFHCCGMNRTSYLMNASAPIPQDRYAQFREALTRRAQHVPLQHITGEAYFMGYAFLVNSHVLVPRPDTEVLVMETAAAIQKRAGEQLRVLDLCTGSGCIAISLKKECPRIECDASDLSEAALETAAENGRRLGAEVNWISGDLFEKLSGRYDIIVSNPPYITSGEIGMLESEVRDHDPRMALDGGEDGLDFYRRICAGAPDFLCAGGGLFLEIGCDQAEPVRELMRENGFSSVRLVKDLAGRDRVLCGCLDH